MGPGQKLMIPAGLGQFFVAQVGSGWVNFLWLRLGRVGFEFGKFPFKISNFSIFFNSGGKKISSGRVKKYPVQRRVGLLFDAGQK